jgi:hypothetical protein
VAGVNSVLAYVSNRYPQFLQQRANTSTALFASYARLALDLIRIPHTMYKHAVMLPVSIATMKILCKS